MSYIWSEHALQRKQERFPEINLDVLLYRARLPGRGTKRKILKGCPVSQKTYHSEGFTGRYHLHNQTVVFVIEAPNTVITVFDMKDRGCDVAI